MSHLTPHRSVRITPGGSAVASPSAAGPPAVPDTSWEGLISDLAGALQLEPTVAVDFATKVDQVVEALAEHAGLEVARTRVRAALLGNTAMYLELVDVDLSDDAVAALLASWEQAAGDEGDRILARLALMHEDLVEPAIPPGPDATVGEGSGGSAAPLPEPVIGQVAYTLDQVPHTAKGVIAWIDLADTSDDRRARAQAALEVEGDREEQRVTVVNAIAGVLDG